MIARRCVTTACGFLLVIAAIFFFVSATASAAVFHVSPNGKDSHRGTVAQPLASLTGARDAVRASGLLGREPIEVQFEAGTYYLPATVEFTAADSGTALAPVVYRAAPDATVVLSGGRRLRPEWRSIGGGIFATSVPVGITIDQLFVNGVAQPMARYPNFDASVAILNGFAADALAPDRVARWADPSGGYIHAMHPLLWGDAHFRITGKKPDGTIAYEGGWQNNRPMGMHDRYRFVENIREELDAPGEWFHDRKSAQLLYFPARGTDLAHATIEVSQLDELIVFRGTPAAPVHHVALAGFIFRHANRTFMQVREPLLRSDWCIARLAAVRFAGAEDCLVDHCEFDQLGGNAVFLSGYNRRVALLHSWIHDCGANGVAFVGLPDAVRSPLFNYDQRLSYAEIDRRPGPRSDDYPSECRVEDTLITNIGRVEKQVAGVEISTARRITVRDCTIAHLPRAGINIGDGTWGGHLVEGCDVFDTVLETGDHGSFNAWGRDRYWQLRDASESELADLALLDAIDPIVLRHNRWRCDHGWDIDLDDGASNYEIYDNLLLGGGLKLREGFRRHVWNNVIVNNSLHPHVWYAGSGDTFTQNIVMGRYRAIGIQPGHWGRELDHNLFTTDDADRTAYGTDAHSLVGDAHFINARAGDFRVAADSPALKVGFENFSMDRFGVRDATLRAHAPVPEIPPLRRLLANTHAPVYGWLDAEIRDLEGAEFSAFGVSQESGGVVVLDAPGHSAAVQAGLRTGDVIVGCGGAPVHNVADLVVRISVAPANRPLPFQLRREQADVTVTLANPPPAPKRTPPQP